MSDKYKENASNSDETPLEAPTSYSFVNFSPASPVEDKKAPEELAEIAVDEIVDAVVPAPKDDSKSAPKIVKSKKSAGSTGTVLTSDITVSKSKIVFESLFERNSRSVGVLQIRLIELGYPSAGEDKRGFLSSGTKKAIEEFQDDNGLEAFSFNDGKVVDSIFAGTPVVLAL
jgi:hypothetical protein